EYDIERPHYFCLWHPYPADQRCARLARIGKVRHNGETGAIRHTRRHTVENDGSEVDHGALQADVPSRKEGTLRLCGHSWKERSEAFEERVRRDSAWLRWPWARCRRSEELHHGGVCQLPAGQNPRSSRRRSDRFER